MSFPKLTAVCSRVGQFFTSQRALHRSPDRVYMELWNKQGGSFREKFMRSHSLSSAGSHLYQSPKLVERVLRTTTAAKQKGEIPFVHAVPAASKVVMGVAHALCPEASDCGRPFKLLRSPQSVYGTMTREEAWASVPDKEERTQMPGLLSMSYALTSGSRALETASSWGFQNHGGNAQYHALSDQLQELLQQNGLERGSEAYRYFEQMGIGLIRKYNRMPVGNFLVVSVPADRVDRYVYDSRAFNVPTGQKASDVALYPEKHADALLENGMHMATMPLCKETLYPDSGIAVVNANDPAEVDAFCADIPMDPMQKVAAFDGLVSQEATEFEEGREKRSGEADEKLDAFMKELTEYKRTGQFDPFGKEPEGFEVNDFSEQLP